MLSKFWRRVNPDFSKPALFTFQGIRVIDTSGIVFVSGICFVYKYPDILHHLEFDDDDDDDDDDDIEGDCLATTATDSSVCSVGRWGSHNSDSMMTEVVVMIVII